MMGIDVPLVDSPDSMTVVRFTQLGIAVKSCEVPDVVATSVPLTMAPLRSEYGVIGTIALVPALTSAAVAVGMDELVADRIP